MAVQNSLPSKKQTTKNEVVFEANGSRVTLTPEIVRNYLVSGDKERVTMQEVVMFINLCKYNGLNPWLKEAYCIKYGNEPATVVPSKEAFTKRAEEYPQYDGYKAGIVVYSEDSGEIERREGSMVIKGETIIGGFAEVFRKDRSHSYKAEVAFDEYAGRKKDGTLNRQWASKPGTMIRKVALVQALREAFPQAMSGMEFAEEQGVAEPAEPVNYAQQPMIMEEEQRPELPQYASDDPLQMPQASEKMNVESDGQQSFFK